MAALVDIDTHLPDPSQEECPYCGKPLPDAPPAGSRDAHVPRTCPACGALLPQFC